MIDNTLFLLSYFGLSMIIRNSLETQQVHKLMQFYTESQVHVPGLLKKDLAYQG